LFLYSNPSKKQQTAYTIYWELLLFYFFYHLKIIIPILTKEDVSNKTKEAHYPSILTGQNNAKNQEITQVTIVANLGTLF